MKNKIVIIVLDEQDKLIALQRQHTAAHEYACNSRRANALIKAMVNIPPQVRVPQFLWTGIFHTYK